MSESANNEQENQVLQLIPIHPETKEPIDAEAGRPTLTILTSPPVFLGDNDSTGIVDPSLSHTVVKVYIKGAKILAFSQKDARGGVVVNDTLLPTGTRHKLKVGDIIGLTTNAFANEMDYAYKVEQVDAATAAANTAAASRAEAFAASSSSAAATLPKEVGEETMCAICMEIMVQPRSVVPCGHNFCKNCLTGQSQCASCRGPITSHIPCRGLENLIGLFTSSKCQDVAIYEEGDLDSYHTRSNKKRSPAKASANRSTNKCRRTTSRRAVPVRRRTQSRSRGSSAPNAITIE